MKSSLCYLIAIHFIFFSFSLLARPSSNYKFIVFDSKKYPLPPLHSAVYRGNLKKVKELIDSEDVNKKFKSKGGTPLYWAIRALKGLKPDSGYVSVCIEKKNIRRGCIKTMEYPNCLKEITNPDVNYLEIIKLLIEKGADINVQNQYPSFLTMAIDRISKKNNTMTEIVKLLIEKGADVNAKKGSYSLLHIISIRTTNYPHNPHTLEIVKLLVEKGADINAKNKSGRTALDYLTRKNPQHIKYLKSKGAKATIWYKKLMFLFY